jgi:hypothetical protein
MSPGEDIVCKSNIDCDIGQEDISMISGNEVVVGQVNVINDMTLLLVCSQLITHFAPFFGHNQIKWPKSNN